MRSGRLSKLFCDFATRTESRGGQHEQPHHVKDQRPVYGLGQLGVLLLHSRLDLPDEAKRTTDLFPDCRVAQLVNVRITYFLRLGGVH